MFFIAAIATVGVLAAACNKSGSNHFSHPIYLTVSDKQVTDGVTTLTEYSWDENGTPTGEVCKVNDKKVYQDSGYNYDTEECVITYTRTNYDESGADISHETRVAQYYSPEWTNQTGLEVYDADNPANTTPLRGWKYYYTNGLRNKYEETVNGVATLVYDNYQYDLTSTSYRITDSRNDPSVTKNIYIQYLNASKSHIDQIIITQEPTNNEVLFTKYEYKQMAGYPYHAGYKTYNTVYEEDKEPKRVLAEEQANYLDDGSKVTYDTIQYEDDGKTQKSKTSVTVTYKTILKTIYY